MTSLAAVLISTVATKKPGIKRQDCYERREASTTPSGSGTLFDARGCGAVAVHNLDTTCNEKIAIDDEGGHTSNKILIMGSFDSLSNRCTYELVVRRIYRVSKYLKSEAFRAIYSLGGWWPRQRLVFFVFFVVVVFVVVVPLHLCLLIFLLLLLFPARVSATI